MCTNRAEWRALASLIVQHTSQRAGGARRSCDPQLRGHAYASNGPYVASRPELAQSLNET